MQGVFQDPFSSYNPIFKADRVFRIIQEEFFPEIKGREWNDKLESSLEAVGLNPEHVLNKFPHQLSGGQLQRFLIARALLLDIQFLVADEIISMLDASTRIDVLNLLADLKSRGLSILFITHDLSLALLHQRKSGDSLPRLCGGDGRDRRDIRQSAASLHPDADGLGSAPGQEMGAGGGRSWIQSIQRSPAAVSTSKGVRGKDKSEPPGQALVEAEHDHLVACCRC